MLTTIFWRVRSSGLWHYVRRMGVDILMGCSSFFFNGLTLEVRAIAFLQNTRNHISSFTESYPGRLESPGVLLWNAKVSQNILSFTITPVALTPVWSPSLAHALFMWPTNYCQFCLCDVDRVNRATSLMRAILLSLKRKLVRLPQLHTDTGNGIWIMEWCWLLAVSMML